MGSLHNPCSSRRYNYLLVVAVTAAIITSLFSSNFSIMAFIIVRPTNTATTTHQQRVSESPYCALQRSNLFDPVIKANHHKLPMTYYDRGDSDNNDEDNDTDDFISNEDDDFYDLYYDKYMSEQVVSSKANKMEIIRSLQSSFYAEDATKEEEEEKESIHDDHVDDEEDENRISDTGKITRLPLWRVPWTELPGRSNILNVHEPTYTHMFETVLRKSSSSANGCYVGHLHLSGGSKNMKTNAESDEYRLYSFPLKGERKAERKSTTIVGTLLRIVDYVRVNDGRLLLLVQGLERFVITKVHQEYPYSIVDVQLLPDISMDDDNIHKKKKKNMSDNFDVEKDFQLVELPIRNKDKRKTREVEVVDMFDIMGTASLKKLLPFVPFSSQRSQVYYSEIDDEQPQTIQQQQQHNQTSTMKSFYNRLVDSNILKDSSTLLSLANNMDNISNEELERSIWICIDEFFRTKFGPHWIDDYYHATTDITSTTAISTKEKKKLDQIKKNLKCLSTLPVPLELLTLFPANSSWPSNFLLDDLVNALVSYTTTTTNDNNNTKETNEVIIVSDKHDMLSRFINPSALFHSSFSTSSIKEKAINKDEETSVISRKRQTRLSYSASYMLENSLSSITLSNFAQSLQQQKQFSTKNDDKESKENDGDINNNNIDIKTKLRQTLLEVSTTRERLMLLLDLYRQLNIEIMGEFW